VWGGLGLYRGDKTCGNGVTTKTYCLQNARWECEKPAVVDTPRSCGYINCTALYCQSSRKIVNRGYRQPYGGGAEVHRGFW
jgi:hypothetical protein